MTTVGTAASDEFELTDEQQAVVDSNAPALVVMAPAGTGKTETLTRRTERFVNDPASGHARVLVVTYTTRAANEFTERLRDRIGSLMRRVTADTVHGFSQTLLATHGSHVGLPSDFQVLANDADRADLLSSFDSSWRAEDCAGLFRELDLARARGNEHPQLRNWRDALDDRGAVDFSEMIAKAVEVLRIPAVATTVRGIYGLVIVDEAQNLTQQQYSLIAALIGQQVTSGVPLVPTTLLGDPNQSVTGFAGGDGKLMERFATEYGAKRLTLNRNFRSSRRLALLERQVSQQLGLGNGRAEDRSQCAAEGVLLCREFDDEGAETAFVADWATSLLAEGLPAQAVSAGEPNGLHAEDIAVLARHAASLGATFEALADRGHDVAHVHKDNFLMSSPLGAVTLELLRFRSERHHMSAASALHREHGIALAAAGGKVPVDVDVPSADALRSAASPHVELLVPLLRAESPSAFVASLEDCQLPQAEQAALLASWTADRKLISDAWSEFANTTSVAERSWTRFALHFERTARDRDLGPGIRLLTAHKAQAREFKAVAVVGMNDGQFPDFRATSREAKQAELQTFYVAATRASRVLMLTRARERPTRYGSRSTDPSPYLGFVQESDGALRTQAS